MQLGIALAGAWLLTLLALGCASPEPTATPVPAPTATPLGPASDALPASDASPTPQVSPDLSSVMDTVLRALSGDTTGVRAMGESGDTAYIPVLVELLRFPWYFDSPTLDAVQASLAQLMGQPNEVLSEQQQDWEWWADWIGNHPEVRPPSGFAEWKGRLFSVLVDPAMGAFLYDGVKARIRLEEIVWGGVKKDGIPDLTSPPVVTAEEATYLDPSDRVFGVSFNGHHRAYPHRILNPHEMANDVVGGVAFALAY